MAKLQRNDLVVVLWEDAWASSSWMGEPDDDDPLVVEQVGYFLKQTKNGLYLTNGRCLSPNYKPYNGIQFVPAGMIRKVRLLKKCQK